jgi:hypothetical protein
MRYADCDLENPCPGKLSRVIIECKSLVFQLKVTCERQEARLLYSSEGLQIIPYISAL